MAERKSAKAAAGSSTQTSTDVPLQGKHTHTNFDEVCQTYSLFRAIVSRSFSSQTISVLNGF